MRENFLRIATRSSPLALWQALYVRNELLNYHSNLRIEIISLMTQGDIVINTPLKKLGGKRLFIKELEWALLKNKADIAVHSMKDIAISFPDGLGICVLCKRDNPFDAFISPFYKNIKDLPLGSTIGTSSLRRKCQILQKRPDLKIKDLRGNIDTRLAKLDRYDFDAILLSVSGLKRLGLQNRIQQIFDPKDLLPSVGQGSIGIECRLNDIKTISLLKPLHHKETEVCIAAERSLNFNLKGNCKLPIGSYAILDGNEIWLRAVIGSSDGSTIIRSEGKAPLFQAEKLGLSLANNLLNRGAKTILNKIINNNILY